MLYSAIATCHWLTMKGFSEPSQKEQHDDHTRPGGECCRHGRYRPCVVLSFPLLWPIVQVRKSERDSEMVGVLEGP